MNRLKIIILFFLTCSRIVPALSQTGIGQWRSHLPYSKAIKVTEGDNKIYCAISEGLFYYDKTSNSISKLTKVEGLSDVGISSINYSAENNVLVVAYSNSNIDLITGNRIYNIPDIKNKTIMGNRTINQISFRGTDACLSCGFGIVVLNLARMEIKDTYIIGAGGSEINVFGTACNGNYIFAAAENGIYKANLNSNLVDFHAWQRIEDIPDFDKKYNAITAYNGKIYVNYSSETFNNDAIYQFDNDSWSIFKPERKLQNISLKSCNGKLVVVSNWNNDVYDSNGNNLAHVTVSDHRDAIYDKDNILWVADYDKGLVKCDNSGQWESVSPNGPKSANAMSISCFNHTIFVAGGGRNSDWNNIWNKGEIFTFKDENWKSKYINSLSDIIRIIVNPQNSKEWYAASWGYGLLQFNEDSLVTIFNQTNSTLQNAFPDNSPYVRIGGLAYDSRNNLWMTNSHAANCISVKLANGKWQSFPYKKLTNADFFGDILITNNDIKWVLMPNKGLFVFDNNNTLDNTQDDRTKRLDVINEAGETVNSVYSFAEDLDGAIWLGTNKGILVYYNPNKVFDENDFSAQRILIPRNDGTNNADALLSTETVNTIAVDGGNRKWIGTDRSGAYLVSSNGLKEICHFTAENSPLLSNRVLSIAVDGNSGEVFFGTDKGIVSYRATATKAGETFKDVYVFPNPVKGDYQGDIIVTGLMADTNVKITDISGNLVYETKSVGGQAVWHGKNLHGQRVHTGVYLVFCASSDGTQTCVTKILFIR
ncbi:MAG: hypothetical protein Q8910_02300 [Bacteroidota bacterium]|nr:hypothetical protein [Bacteroidota bacterium]